MAKGFVKENSIILFPMFGRVQLFFESQQQMNRNPEPRRREDQGEEIPK